MDRQIEQAGRHQGGREADQLHPLRRANVLDDFNRSRRPQKVGDFIFPTLVTGSILPTANQDRDGGEWRVTTPGSNMTGENLDHASYTKGA
ncbi:MAG: hypothetical protein GY798_28465 [Hyphomicrobiales bacterium]|nr:hypothetical protein [Hyphomicrobiales bacterium]